MKPHIEHTGVSGRHVCPSGPRVDGWGRMRQDPSYCFHSSCLTILNPDPTTSLDEIAYPGMGILKLAESGSEGPRDHREPIVSRQEGPTPPGPALSRRDRRLCPV